MNNLAEIDLKRLLKICVDPANKYYQQGWYEFERRYQKLMLGKILSITKNQENVKDIAQMVMVRLMVNDFRALKTFRAKDSEPTFKAFLNVICRMTSFAYLAKTSKEVALDNEGHLVSPEPQNNGNGTHEKIVSSLRKIINQTQKSDYNKERDIFIFALRKISEFKAKEVAQIPVLKIKADHVDTVVGRLMKDLRKNNDDLRDS